MRSAVPLLPLVLAALVGLVVTLDHAGEEIYHLPAYAVAAAVLAFAAAAAGVALAWRTRHPGSALAAALIAALLLLGVAAILSIGIFLLAAALTLVVVLVMRPPRGEGGGRALAGGALVGLALPIVALTAFSQPLVDCATGRAGENVFLGLQSSSSSSSGTSSPDGTSSGSLAGEGYELEYACDGDRLVKFELRTG